MNPIVFAMRRPLTVMVMVAAVALASFVAIARMSSAMIRIDSRAIKLGRGVGTRGELVDWSTPPWDEPSLRPSRAEKRRDRRRSLLGEETRAVMRPGVTQAEIQAVAERFESCAA